MLEYYTITTVISFLALLHCKPKMPSVVDNIAVSAFTALWSGWLLWWMYLLVASVELYLKDERAK